MAHWKSTTRNKTYISRQLNELIIELTDNCFRVMASDDEKLKNERSIQYQFQKESALQYLQTCTLYDEEKIEYAKVVADRLIDIRDAPYDVNRNCYGAVKKECHERRDDDKRKHHMIVANGDEYLWRDVNFDDVMKLNE